MQQNEQIPTQSLIDSVRNEQSPSNPYFIELARRARVDTNVASLIREEVRNDTDDARFAAIVKFSEATDDYSAIDKEAPYSVFYILSALRPSASVEYAHRCCERAMWLFLSKRIARMNAIENMFPCTQLTKAVSVRMSAFGATLGEVIVRNACAAELMSFSMPNEYDASVFDPWVEALASSRTFSDGSLSSVPVLLDALSKGDVSHLTIDDCMFVNEICIYIWFFTAGWRPSKYTLLCAARALHVRRLEFISLLTLSARVPSLSSACTEVSQRNPWGASECTKIENDIRTYSCLREIHNKFPRFPVVPSCARNSLEYVRTRALASLAKCI